jgi:hypothetical protein
MQRWLILILPFVVAVAKAVLDALTGGEGSGGPDTKP